MSNAAAGWLAPGSLIPGWLTVRPYSSKEAVAGPSISIGDSAVPALVPGSDGESWLSAPVLPAVSVAAKAAIARSAHAVSAGLGSAAAAAADAAGICSAVVTDP